MWSACSAQAYDQLQNDPVEFDPVEKVIQNQQLPSHCYQDQDLVTWSDSKKLGTMIHLHHRFGQFPPENRTCRMLPGMAI